MHSSSGKPHGTFTVRIHDFPGDCVYAEVEDGGSSWHGDLERSAEPRHGLHIMQMLASACGTDMCACGHVVWFTVSYPHDASAPAPTAPDGDPFKLKALRSACPEFAFRSIDIAGKRSIEAVRITGPGTLYAVITSDPAELWRIVRFSRRNTDESS